MECNCISFHGVMTTDVIKLEEGKFGFILRGENQEEFPLIIVKSNSKPELLKNDNISAVGYLARYQNDWAIYVYKLLRIPDKEEIEKLT